MIEALTLVAIARVAPPAAAYALQSAMCFIHVALFRVSVSCMLSGSRSNVQLPDVVHPFCDVQRAYCSRNRKSSGLVPAQKVVAITTFHVMIPRVRRHVYVKVPVWRGGPRSGGIRPVPRLF